MISVGVSVGDVWEVGEGSPPEPIAPGDGISDRVHASVARISAERNRQILHLAGVNLSLKMLLARDLIEFIATRTRF